jgi:hypothetical protein
VVRWLMACGQNPFFIQRAVRLQLLKRRTLLPSLAGAAVAICLSLSLALLPPLLVSFLREYQSSSESRSRPVFNTQEAIDVVMLT